MIDVGKLVGLLAKNMFLFLKRRFIVEQLNYAQHSTVVTVD